MYLAFVLFIICRRLLHFAQDSRFYRMNVFNDYSMTVTIGEEPCILTLNGTTGNGEDYYRLRPVNYPETDVLLVCFSVVSPVTFENVKKEVFQLNV